MRRDWLIVVLISLILGFALALPGSLSATALAQEHGAAATGEHGGAKQGEVNVFGWALDLAIWTIVVFLVLLFVLSRFAWKPMLEGLQRREEHIRSSLEEAQRARDEAQRIRDQLQDEMNRASEKVRDLLDQGRRDAQATTEEMVSKARAEIQTERDRLRREIELARDQALQELWNRTAGLAAIVSSKAIRRQLTAEDHRRLVDEAIAEFREAGAERQRQVSSV